VSADAKSLPSIQNAGYFSDYYLAYRLDAGLADLYGRWDRAAKLGQPTARSRVRGLGGAFTKFRVDAAATASAADDLDESRLRLEEIGREAAQAQRSLNDEILEALGWAPTRDQAVELTSGHQTVTVPVAHRCETHSGTLLLAIDTVFSTNPGAVTAGKTAPEGRLLAPVMVDNSVGATTALEAAQLIFGSDQPPRYLLLMSGGALTLLDRDRWGEGVSLGANLDDAVGRADHRDKGELAAIAALFSADAINPGEDAQSVLTALIEKANTESAGVSKELRHGIRRSVELLANAVVTDMRDRQKVAWKDDPKDLTRQTLRYIYRIIVLLFAESRPELGILPTNDPDYQSGYSLARLRDIALVDLQTDHARSARHIQHSLTLLFALVNNGHAANNTFSAQDERELTFPGLRSALFAADAAPIVDRAHLSDEVLQQVVANLCFTKERAGAQRQAVSYATLGINQLGAVYEGLMAYSGFLATEPLNEIARVGTKSDGGEVGKPNADKGSWVIPVSRADEFPSDVFLEETAPDGSTRRIAYKQGDFVFRLSGRDRQSSASYYTPEILTEFTVRHALEVFFDENPDLAAADILHLTVCEPALGSGAFLNEAVNQLAARYLKAAQDERAETIDPDRYRNELQKAKAHFAVNQAFGVDLNQTAVELAEVSLWLNCMHDRLQAPWFGARLRRGNSLVGARRATYSLEQVRAASWAAKKAPAERPLSSSTFGDHTGIHHFLVPGEGWGAAHQAAEIKELDPAWTIAIKTWQKRMHAPPTQRQTERLQAIAAAVEDLWRRSADEVRQFWEATRQHIDVWGNDTAPPGNRLGDQAIRTVLNDHRSPTCRLRTVMHAWCSLWLWAPQHGTDLPTFDGWLDAIEMMVGRPEAQESGVLFDDTPAAADVVAKASEIDDAERVHPWLIHCRSIAEQQGWFHWELEYAPVFLRGGFDIQVGNPPWVRPRWSDDQCLAEDDPWFGVTEEISEDERRIRRNVLLAGPTDRARYLAERAENEAMNAVMGAVSREPLLAGQQNNLYLLFITGTWRRANAMGATALIHPEGHLGDPKAGVLRSGCYLRLRRHWHFINELMLFKEISHTREYGIHIYGTAQPAANFIQAAFLYHPSVVDRSLTHDGTGELPGRKLATGEWDLRPHAQRLVNVTTDTLKAWAGLLAHSDPSNPPIVRTVTSAEALAAEAVAKYPHRLASSGRFWDRGFDEYRSPKIGFLSETTHQPQSWNETILQGPNFGICNPLAKQPRLTGKHQQDYEPLDLPNCPRDAIPRTNWKRKVSREAFEASLDAAGTLGHLRRYRIACRTMVPSNTHRSVFMSMIPPGTTTMGGCYSGALPDDLMTLGFCGLSGSLLVDYAVRATGMSNLHTNVVDRLPMVPRDHVLLSPIAHRALRLNALTGAYAELWDATFDVDWTELDPAPNDYPLASGAIWAGKYAARRDLDRWLLLTELDALAALTLGSGIRGLVGVYRSQFPVLRAYEYEMVFDSTGCQIAKDHHAYGVEQARWEASNKEVKAGRGAKKTGMWGRVVAYEDGDRTVDLDGFAGPFVPADRELAMTTAYWTFVERFELDPPDSKDRPS